IVLATDGKGSINKVPNGTKIIRKATIEKSIDTLEAKIAKIEASESSQTQASAASKPAGDDPKELSGESERIGTTNFDET
ncbi:hypothetical protein ACCT31_39185, partial [Rhizobium ruizarguesonis]